MKRSRLSPRSGPREIAPPTTVNTLVDQLAMLLEAYVVDCCGCISFGMLGVRLDQLSTQFYYTLASL